MAKLVLHIPGGGTRDIALSDGRITIGRRADNDVCLPYPAVSAEHAAVITVLDDSFLEDLQSTNGTLVNDKRIVKHFLRDRDTIDVGRVQLVYLEDENEVVAPISQAKDGGETEQSPSSNASSFDDAVAADTSVDDDEGMGADAVIENDGADDERADSVAGMVQGRAADNLLADLMDSNLDAMVAVDIPPAVSVVSTARAAHVVDELRDDITRGVYVEVLNGPNAGQIVPMTRRRFVLGKAGSTVAEIRREGNVFSLVPVDLDALTLVNGERVLGDGLRLAFGDAIDVAGVKLRFGRRTPL